MAALDHSQPPVTLSLTPSAAMAWPRITGALLGLYALVGGVLSFTGWVFNLPRLTDWYNNGISIQPNTCIAVMAAGAGLIFLTFGYRRVAACLGVVVALIGGTVVFQYLTG